MNLIKEKYLIVRKAQAQGVRKLDELKNATNISIENDTEVNEIESLLKNVCKCKNVSVQEVLNAVNNGADTVEIVGEATGAGTACGRCKSIISDIIENRR